MSLIDNFFKVLKNSITDKGFVTTIKLNHEHIIYTGHFPGYPVTPGVIQMQIVHELLEYQLGIKIKLVEMPQCKFIKILTPTETSMIDVDIAYNLTDELIRIQAQGENGSDIFFKINSTYRIC